jgi:Dolichyl-phosphate-mannose-protein mannosyltransferase
MGRKKKRNKTGRLASSPRTPRVGVPSGRIPAWRAALPWIFLGLILLFVVAVRIRVLPVPLERDEGEYAYAGQLILEGIPPYQLAYNVKLPGIYAAYALLMAIFGQTPSGIHLGLLIVNLGAIVLLFFLARRLFDSYAAVIASATYALMSTSTAVMGLRAHATHFVILAALGGFVLLLRGLESRRALTLFWSGLLFGVAVLMKQHGVFLGVFAFSVLLYSEWSSKIAANSAGSSAGSLEGSGTDAKKSLLPGLWRVAAFSFGTVVPYALTCLVLWRTGVFKNFWRWTVVYAGGHSLPYTFQGLARNFQDGGFFPSLCRPFRSGLDQRFRGRLVGFLICCGQYRLLFFPALFRPHASGTGAVSGGRMHPGGAKTPPKRSWDFGHFSTGRCLPDRVRVGFKEPAD